MANSRIHSEASPDATGSNLCLSSAHCPESTGPIGLLSRYLTGEYCLDSRYFKEARDWLRNMVTPPLVIARQYPKLK